jgi:membrane protein
MKVLSPAEAWQLARLSSRGWVEDNAASMSAALAFYTLFSLAPLLLVALAIAGFFVGRHEAHDVLIAQLTQVIGEKAALGIESLLDSAGSRAQGGLPAVVGVIALVIGATSVFAELRSDLDRIWRAHRAKSTGLWDWTRSRLLSFAMVVAMGFLLLVSLVAGALLHGLDFVTPFLVVMLLFAMIYKFLPTARIAWSDVWVGAAVTSVFFWLGKLAIGLYIAKAALASSFGAAGTLVVVIAWVYYSSLAFFLGAEFTREYALRHGSKRGERLEERRRCVAPPAANDDEMVERARQVVKGRDPVLVRTTSEP